MKDRQQSKNNNFIHYDFAATDFVEASMVQRILQNTKILSTEQITYRVFHTHTSKHELVYQAAAGTSFFS